MYPKKLIATGVLLTALFVITSKNAFAHITVNPKDAITGKNLITLRVENEKDIPTTSVRVVIPEDVDVLSISPVVGWTHTEIVQEIGGEDPFGDDHDFIGRKGRVKEITWKGNLGATEFIEFPMLITYNLEGGRVYWKAYQTYSNGEVVAWDDKDLKLPSSKVNIHKEDKLVTLTNKVNQFSIQTEKPVVVAPTFMQKLVALPWLSIAALLVSVVALVLSFKGKRG